MQKSINKFLKITIAVLLAIISLSIVACNMRGFRVINWGGGARSWPAFVEGKQRQYDINSVELKFGYGHPYEIEPIQDEDYQVVGFCLYFQPTKGLPYAEYRFDDYRNVDEGWFFIKEISFEKFASDNYHIVDRWPRRDKFNHTENIKIPPQVFVSSHYLDVDKIAFTVIDVYFIKSEQKYGFGWQTSGVTFRFKKKDNTIYFGKDMDNIN